MSDSAPLPTPAIVSEYAQKMVDFGICVPGQELELTRMLRSLFREGFVYCLEVEGTLGHMYALAEGMRLMAAHK